MPLMRSQIKMIEQIARRVFKEEIGKLDLKRPVKVDAKDLISMVLKNSEFVGSVQSMVNDLIPKPDKEPVVKKTAKK